jgi:hypothetical protein
MRHSTRTISGIQPSDDGTDFDPAKLEAETAAAARDTGPDPFDVESLRLSQTAAAGLGVKKALLSIPVRKPDKSWFVRTHPDPAYRLETAVLELKEDRETYLVARDLWPELAAETVFSPRALYTAISRQGVLFLWPIRLPGPDGRAEEWSRSALEATRLAAKGWVRVTANLSLGAYEVLEALGQLGEPAWPELPFQDLLRIAFKNRYVSSTDHPVLRRLRGEV